MLLRVLRHVNSNHGAFIIEEELRQGLSKFGLTNARRAKEEEGTCGSVRIGQACTRTADSIRNRADSILLTNQSMGNEVLHMDELLALGLEQLAHGDSSPRFDNLSDLGRANFFGNHWLIGFVRLLFSLNLFFLFANLTFDLRNIAVLETSCFFEATGTNRQLQLGTQLIQLDAELTHAVVASLFGFPTAGESSKLFVLVRKVLPKLLEALRRGLVQAIGVRLGQVGLFHAQTIHLATQNVNFLGRGVKFHAQAGGSLVDQVNGFIGKLTPGDVAIGKLCRCNQSTVRNGDLVVCFVLRCNTAQNCDGIFNRRLTNEHLLETAFKSGVLFDVLAVLIQGCCADHAELATGQHGLEHVARIHCSFRATTGTNDRVKFVDKGDDLAVRSFDLAQNSLEAFLEFTAILRARNHPGQIKSDQLLVLQRFGDVACDDSLGEAFDDGGLTDAGLTDQNRVVLGSAGQHLDHAANFAIATNHRIEFSLARYLGQVASVLLQRLEGTFGVSAGNGIGAKLI